MPSPRIAASSASGMLFTTRRPRTGTSTVRPRERNVQRPRGASGVKRMQSWRSRSRGVRGVPRSRRYSRAAKQRGCARHSSCATRKVSFSVPERNARSNFSSTRSTCRSVSTSSMLIWGCRARHSATTSPRSPSPSATGAVTRSRPAVSSELVESARPASRIVPSAGLQARRYVLPALVSSTRRVVRWRRRVPSARSSSLIRRLSVERGTPNASAAPRKLRSSATRTKSSTAPTSIVPCMGHIVP